MPTIKSNQYSLEYQDSGNGPVVVLIHGAASNNRQWRQLHEAYRDQFRFLAPNLFGYGETSVWPSDRTQTILDQAGLIETLCSLVDGPLSIVGHSFGASVAAAAAHSLGEKVQKLVLLEANPFPLLKIEGQEAGREEIEALWKYIQKHSPRGEWTLVAERFVNYWMGEGSWSALSEERQQAFLLALPNNVHEWDTIMNMDVSESMWQGIKADTMFMRAQQTKQSIIGISAVLKSYCPHWQFQEVAEGGHMAPMTRPDLVNPLIIDFLNA
ncbi:MAG: alpha/beta fold hydrolase [Gammaproteobacteria bacterium]|nr:alpha/beta fold hydrolase [Gammaproteobacteria bacterium]